jgi:hypothetical protein
MKNTNTGGSAFPTPAHNLQNDGMTLRDYFAAKAMLGSIARDGGSLDESVLKRIAAESYAAADTMLKARE